jgi:hypothetical protein
MVALPPLLSAQKAAMLVSGVREDQEELEATSPPREAYRANWQSGVTACDRPDMTMTIPNPEV